MCLVVDPISKNIFWRQNPLELVFQDISTFDAQNPVIGSLLRELDIGRIDIASDPAGKAPRPSLIDDIQKKLDALRKDYFLIIRRTIIIAITIFHHHRHHQHLIILSHQYCHHRPHHHLHLIFLICHSLHHLHLIIST